LSRNGQNYFGEIFKLLPKKASAALGGPRAE
jgi:hypothetical protein